MIFKKNIHKNRVLFHEKMFHAGGVNFVKELHVFDLIFAHIIIPNSNSVILLYVDI
jgi:hypothetical protein